jgi:hypothetical protein
MFNGEYVNNTFLSNVKDALKVRIAKDPDAKDYYKLSGLFPIEAKTIRTREKTSSFVFGGK